MPLAPRTPVLVGVAAVQQRIDDPASAREPLALMADALERAAEDAGSGDLLSRADSIRAPRGFWDYPDPCRWLGDHFGAKNFQTQVAEVGVLQTTLFGNTARDIANGDADVVLLTGAEAKFRTLRAQIAGVEERKSQLPPGEADVVLRPGADIIHPLEIATGIPMPVNQYAIIENALRAADGQTIEEHVAEVARMWSAMSEVATRNPDAWRRDRVSADEIATQAGKNRMLAFPYTKLHNSQWNVDQAAGLIFCSYEAARAAGVSDDRMIYPRAVAESNFMLPLSERVRVDRCRGFRIAAEEAHTLAGLRPEEVIHRELYSCFPSAVRVQLRELGIDPLAPTTETGGMAFAGGPLNNFVLQALVRMAQVLRDDPESAGMLNAVSGVLTKQGVSLWAARPGGAGFGLADVSEAAEAATERVDVAADQEGAASIVSYTVLYDGTDPARGVALCDMDAGVRTLAVTDDPDIACAMTHEEFCGRRVTLGAGARVVAVGG